MNVPSQNRTTDLQEAYAFALEYPVMAVVTISLSRGSRKEDVTSTFTKIFLHNGKNRLDNEWGTKRLNEGIELFLSKREIPDFVARFIAGVTIGEINPATVIGKTESPP